MNFFPFHVGDYSTHTAHLEPLEDLAYRRMLDVYYLRESPLPSDPKDVARLIRMRANVAEVEIVLNEFFHLEADGWHQFRCDDELVRMKGKQTKARASAAASVRARSTNAQRTLTDRSPTVELPIPIPIPIPKKKETLADSPLRAEPPPPFDGKNFETLNGKSVVALSATWELPEAWGVDAESLGWHPKEVLLEAEKFRQYWTSGKGTGSRRAVKGWRQTWSNWLGKAAERKLR